ncbi:MAG: transcriptional regulator [Caulobacteraceae bacterium]|nr:transcriptional regulator [Caulobacteraceae bacterium]
MNNQPLSAIDDTAVDWFVLLRDPSASEAQFIAFRDWLEASPAHRAAYDRVEQVWVTLEAAPATAPAPFQPRRAFTVRPGARRFAFGAGATAALAAGLAAVLILPQMMAPPRADIYRTAKGERREVSLADGSKITLNSASEVRVQLGRKSRHATVVSGEALFDVAHDPARPFTTAVGDEQVRDIGTVFNVRQDGDRLTVTVLSGLVEVTPQTGAVTRLGQGDELKRRIGFQDASLTRVNAEDTTGWRSGRLIYRDQPLSEVTADLNRYLPVPISADAKAGALRFSGVLQLDREEVMVGRLERLLPVRAAASATSVRLTSRD